MKPTAHYYTPKTVVSRSHSVNFQQEPTAWVGGRSERQPLNQQRRVARSPEEQYMGETRRGSSPFFHAISTGTEVAEACCSCSDSIGDCCSTTASLSIDCLGLLLRCTCAICSAC